MQRFAARVVVLVTFLSIAGCGSGEITLTEYVDSVNEAAAAAGDRAAALMAEGVLGEDVSPQDVEAGMLRGIDEIRIPLQSAVDSIQPPEQVAELHIKNLKRDD